MTTTAPPQLLEVVSKVDARLEAVLDHQHDHWNAIDPRLGDGEHATSPFENSPRRQAPALHSERKAGNT